MVVILPGINAETQHHHIEKSRIRQRHTTGAVIVARVEVQLVDPTAVVIALQNRPIATAIVVGHHRGDQLLLPPLDPIQLNLDRTARATVRSV